ncbi:MAG TPA: hypothetical protein VGP17_07845 [Solirubrobacteraceae bacterium]|jgi:hypothetical protein|nr:hypothetical protein [Solirubrobacteraceae bacterium]
MNDQLEEDLRNALGQHAAEVPDAVAARLRQIDYRPRSPRLGVALTVGGAASVAAAAGAIVSVIGLGAGTQTAFAGWSASPTAPASGQTAAAEAACLARVPSSSDAERARDDGTAHAPVMEALLKIAPDEWRTVLADTRGSFTMIMLEAAKGQAQASCLSSPSSSVISIGPVGGRVASPAAGQAQVVSSGSQRASAGNQFTYTEGRVGVGVTGVSILLADGTHVSATVANEHFAAWWPGSQQAVSQEVATSSGTSTHQLEYAAPASTSAVR